ncbi:hypothetical protein ACGF3J_29825, partial [Streptomyces sp. NPDC048171]
APAREHASPAPALPPPPDSAAGTRRRPRLTARLPLRGTAAWRRDAADPEPGMSGVVLPTTLVHRASA